MTDVRRLVKLPENKTFTCGLCGGPVVFWTSTPLNPDGSECVDWSQLMSGAQCSVCLASLSLFYIEIKEKEDTQQV
jgi:transcription elongation factor Elf1